MPTITAVSVTYGRRLNLGDYNNAHIEISLWADVIEEEDLDDAMQRLWLMAIENVKAQALPLKSNYEAKVEEFYLGLPKELKEAANAHQRAH